MNAKYKTVAILGRQPALGVAELESLYGAEHIGLFGNHCLLDISAKLIDFNRLGGSVRIATIIAELDATKWQTIEKNILQNVADIFNQVDGKLAFGLSVYGMKASPKDIAKTALLLKKSIKSTGQSVRMVPHKSLELNAATVLYNKLTSQNGYELLVLSDGNKTILAKTTAIQDIDAYTARDRERPMRDAKVGMLPPKLAQIIINLAIGPLKGLEIGDRRLEKKQKTAAILNPQSPIRVLDAFCGTGVILQEAMLMDYDVYGTDIDQRMIEYSIENLEWLDRLYPSVGDYRRIEIGDASSFQWYKPDLITAVAGETYLGQPLSTLPPGDQLSKIMHEVNNLHHKFLENLSPQITPGTRLCLAIPTWRGKHEFLHLSMLDYLSDLGYTRMRFEHAKNEDLIYHRENQVVGRELLVLTKN